MLAAGAILIATTQFIPQSLQEYYGYTATLSGLVLAPGGIVTWLMMFVIGRVSGLPPAEMADRRRRDHRRPRRCTT